MPITRWRGQQWSPFRELARLQSEMDRLFSWPWARRGRYFEMGFTPPVDLYEEEGRLRCKVELPGLKREDIEISATENSLTIRGNKKREREVDEEDDHFMERWFGEFERTIEFPTHVDPTKVEATLSDGILEVTIPMHAGVPPKQIEVKAR